MTAQESWNTLPEELQALIYNAWQWNVNDLACRLGGPIDDPVRDCGELFLSWQAFASSARAFFNLVTPDQYRLMAKR